MLVAEFHYSDLVYDQVCDQVLSRTKWQTWFPTFFSVKNNGFGHNRAAIRTHVHCDIARAACLLLTSISAVMLLVVGQQGTMGDTHMESTDVMEKQKGRAVTAQRGVLFHLKNPCEPCTTCASADAAWPKHGAEGTSQN